MKCQAEVLERQVRPQRKERCVLHKESGISGRQWEAIPEKPMLLRLQNCINLLERNNGSHSLINQSAQVAITKHCGLGSLNNRHLFSQFRRLKCEIKMPAGLVPGEASLPGLQTAPSFCVHTWLFLPAQENERALLSLPPYKDKHPIGLGSCPYDLIYL